MNPYGWFGLGLLVGSGLALWWSLMQEERLLQNNKHLLQLLTEAYQDLDKAERDAYGSD